MSEKIHTKTAACLTMLCLLLLSLLVMPGIGGSRSAVAATGWEQQVSGTSDSLNSVSAVDAETAWAVGSPGTILRTTNGGATWDTLQSGTNDYYSHVDAVSKDVAWFTSYNKVFKTVDGGQTVQLVNTQASTWSFYGLSALDANTAWAIGCHTIVINMDISYFWSAVMKTTDGGATWSVLNESESNVTYSGISRVDQNTLWVSSGAYVLKTADGGATWVKKPVQTDSPFTAISAVDASNAWVTGSYSGKVFRTTDGGASWDNALTFDVSPRILAGRIAAGSATTAIFIGAMSIGSRGLYRTTDGGTTWTQQLGGETPSLADVCSVGVDTAWVVGEQGLILHTTDGGGPGLPVPVSESLTPAKGPVGTEVTITGSNFGALQGSSYVTFGTANATGYTYWSDSEVRCLAPALDPGTARVRVANGWGTAASAAASPLGFQVVPVGSPAPTVTAIDPASSANNTTLRVKITGTGFITEASPRLVQGSTVINGLTVTVQSGTVIYCYFNLNGQPLGKYDVVVRNIDDQEGKLAGGFSVTDICGQGGGGAIILFAGLVGLLSLAGFGYRRRRRTA